MMDDLEALADQVCRLRAELATAKAQLATVTQKWRDCQAEVNAALDRNNAVHQQLATARREGFEAVIAQFPVMACHKDQYEEGQMDERDAITGWCRA